MRTSALGRRGSTRAWRRIRAAVLVRDRGVCAYCGGRADTADHVIPRRAMAAMGRWADDPRNLVAACKPCNLAKGATHFYNGDGPGHPASVSSLPPTRKTPGHTELQESVPSGLPLDQAGPLGRGVIR